MSGALPTRPAHRLRLALMVSLGLNLLLAGFVSVHWVRVHMFHHGLPMLGAPGGGGGRSIEGMFQRAATGLPPADAAVLQSALGAHAADLAAAQRDYTADTDAMRAALLADPFDAGKWRATVDAARDARQRLGPLVEAVMLDAVPHMSADGRQILAKNHGR